MRGENPRAAGEDPARRWADPEAGQRYAARWGDTRRARHDPRLIGRILARHGVEAVGPVLDAPCGTGRLRDLLEGRGRPYVGLDISEPMIREARRKREGGHLIGDLRRLPFADGSFGVVVACRILHHLTDARDLERTVAELVRVSARLVVASFWDRGSLPALGRRLRPRPRARASLRVSHSKADLRDVLARAGAEVLGFEHTLRRLSQQTFVVAEKRAPRTG